MHQFQPEIVHSVMLKLSGEILAGHKGFGYDDDVIDNLTDELIAVKRLGYSIAIVFGGGNIFRGGTWKNQDLSRVTLDSIGMLATLQNALYVAEVLEAKGYSTRVFSMLAVDKIARHYSPAAASEALSEGHICFLAGGTGNPFFTTDTAAILRAIELNLDLVLKGTKVDGLYSDDPRKNPDAEFISSASYQECLVRKLGVMDMTAFSLAQENRMPIKIFNVGTKGNLEQALLRADIGTFIHP
ncbi:MAG: UMP kinase [Candidatus Cloacimonetes bacterium HGW-Cloacimonetes-2]|nr:MAG: UMP kinase [Candidatus Cloacimonetes bacterium HGW-Cloacimonetes-2]